MCGRWAGPSKGTFPWGVGRGSRRLWWGRTSHLTPAWWLVVLELIQRRLGSCSVASSDQRMNSQSTCWRPSASESLGWEVLTPGRTKSGHRGRMQDSSPSWGRTSRIPPPSPTDRGETQPGWASPRGWEGGHMAVGGCHGPVAQVTPLDPASHFPPLPRPGGREGQAVAPSSPPSRRLVLSTHKSEGIPAQGRVWPFPATSGLSWLFCPNRSSSPKPTTAAGRGEDGQ